MSKEIYRMMSNCLYIYYSNKINLFWVKYLVYNPAMRVCGVETMNFQWFAVSKKINILLNCPLDIKRITESQ